MREKKGDKLCTLSYFIKIFKQKVNFFQADKMIRTALQKRILAEQEVGDGCTDDQEVSVN